MKPATKKLLESAAEVLNKHVAGGTEAGKLLTGEDRNVVLGLVNEILDETAEGHTLVAAVESSGAILGFVPRAHVQIPDPPKKEAPPAPVPPGPDN